LTAKAADCGPFCPERRASAGSTTASCLCHTYRSMHIIVLRSLYTHCLLFGRCGDRPGARFVIRTLWLPVHLALAASHNVSVIEVRVLAGVSPHLNPDLQACGRGSPCPASPILSFLPQRMQFQPRQGFGTAASIHAAPQCPVCACLCSSGFLFLLLCFASLL
jgi:hypothetical protein